MCVLYVSLGPKVRPRRFECVVLGSAVLFILRSRLLLYSTGSGVNRVYVYLPGFNVRCFVLSRQNFMQVCLYVFLCCTGACVCICDDDVFCVDHDRNWCSGLWYVCRVNVK